MTKRPIKERILDAAEKHFDQYGVQKTTLQGVAEQVGISRMTVYRHFKDRQALFDDAALRNMRRYWRLIGARLTAVDHLDEWILEALMIYQLEFAQDESVQLYNKLNAFDQGFAVALTKPGLAAISDQFQPLFTAIATDDRLSNGLDKNDLAEWTHRLNFSLVKYPNPRFQQEDVLRRWIGAQVCGGVVPKSHA